MKFRIENVVMSAALEDPVDIDIFSGKKEVESVRSGSSCVYRISDSVTVQIFRSGSVICTGARSTEQSVSSIKECMKALGIGAAVTSTEVRDIMVSTDLNRDLDLEDLYVKFGNTAEYNPEWFPGLIVGLEEFGIKAIFYSSGKVVLSGARSMEQVYRCMDEVVAKIT